MSEPRFGMHSNNFFVLFFLCFFPSSFLGFVTCQDFEHFAETQLKPGKVVLMPLAGSVTSSWRVGKGCAVF